MPNINVKKGDQFRDVAYESNITVTSVDVWNNSVEFTRSTDNYNESTFGWLPIQEFDWFVEMGSFKRILVDDDEHHHSWKHYVGFTDIYDYCQTCDIKRAHVDYYCERRH